MAAKKARCRKMHHIQEYPSMNEMKRSPTAIHLHPGICNIIVISGGYFGASAQDQQGVVAELLLPKAAPNE